MSRIVRKEIEALDGKKSLVVSDDWPGSPGGVAAAETVVFQVTGHVPLDHLREVIKLSREDAGDLGRALVELYGEG